MSLGLIDGRLDVPGTPVQSALVIDAVRRTSMPRFNPTWRMNGDRERQAINFMSDRGDNDGSVQVQLTRPLRTYGPPWSFGVAVL